MEPSIHQRAQRRPSQIVVVAQRLKLERNRARDERDQLRVQLAAYEAVLATVLPPPEGGSE